MRLFLLDNGFDIYSTQDEKYDFVMKIASGTYDFTQIHNWISNHSVKQNKHGK